jgi:glyoxylase-like metal-dependent hydrolase (beta-lactamase superfamily II)
MAHHSRIASPVRLALAFAMLVGIRPTLGAVPSLGNPNLRVATDRVYTLVGDLNRQTVENQGFNANMTFIVTQTSVVVLEPGSSVRIGRMVINKIRKTTDKPISHVFNSHFHPDHWLGNYAFAELLTKAMIIGDPGRRACHPRPRTDH